MTLVHNLAAYTLWRTQLSDAITRFRDWLADNELSDAQSEQRLDQVLGRLRDDRLNVAFVAEFSRGKSELINAIFFADYGNRMLPSTAGRTTMCPTELLYDPERPSCLQLLPIETRASKASISDFKQFSDEWQITELDLASAESMQASLRKVSEVVRVPPETAEKLGFDVNPDNADAYHPGKDGLVEIPRWRHAIINFPHPLLKQGLVILDTPGLNAIGAEPELTLSLLPNAHAILFILGADTGVTQSDLAVWQQHLSSASGVKRGRIVVLNKIDGQWDELKSEREINAEIDRQVAGCAATLELPRTRIFPVSAQKGLVAKITANQALLSRSRLPLLEEALSGELIPSKEKIVRESTEGEFSEVAQQMRNLLDSRLHGLREQLAELSELRGKNRGVVEYMMGKVRVEKDEFEAGLQRYYAVRSVFSTLTNNLFGHLSVDTLRQLTQSTRDIMLSATFSRQLSAAMQAYFSSSRGALQKAEAEITEITNMMEAIYKKFSIEHGLKLGTPAAFSLMRYRKELERLEQWCNTHINTVLQLLRHEKGNVTQKFFEEVALHSRRCFELANKDAESWLKAIMSPMETQVREHQIQLKRRLESIKRIHQATDTLEDRIEELTQFQNDLIAQINALESAANCVRDALEHRQTHSKAA